MVDTLYIDKLGDRIEQGDLVENLSYTIASRKGEEISFDSIEFPYMIVVTQDCDLEQDFNQHVQHKEDGTVDDNDKFLGTICLLPAYNAEAVRAGTHLSTLGLRMKKIDSDRWKPLKNNQTERFHFLAADIKKGIPDLAIDFKHQYTIGRTELYATLREKPIMRRYRVDGLFREDLSRRFANFLSRIALPEIKIGIGSVTQ